jgi:hypothetical protein
MSNPSHTPRDRRELHLVRYVNGFRPICGGCGWDDAPHATQSGAEVAFEQHVCREPTDG